MESPYGNTINDIRDPQAQQLDVSQILTLNLSEWWHIVHLQSACFLETLSGAYESH